MSRISNALSMSPEKISNTYADVSLSVVKDLTERGIYMQDDPERDRPSSYDGQVPENLDMLSNDELAHLMVMHQSWTTYLNGCHSSAQASMKVSSRALKGIRNSVEQERGKSYVDSDPRVIHADAQLLYHELKSDIIGDLLKSARNSYQLMSRLITLREQDLNQTTRRNVLTSSRGRGR